jgi:hypothetical protein
MNNRYSNTQKILNNSESYNQLFKQKNVKNIVQYSTFDFGNLNTALDSGIEKVIHVVQPFEKLYTISQKYYGMPEYGWLICYTNKIPNELEIKAGDPLFIYLPLGSILGLL